jgi:hypothetical protein
MAYYEGWKSSQTSVGTQTDWVVAVGTNGSSSSGSFMVNGVASSTQNFAGTGGKQLTINTSAGVNTELSTFGFTYLIIWNQALSDSEIVLVNNALQNYLNTGYI